MTSLKGDLRSIMGTPFGGVGHAVLIFSRVTRAAFNSDSVVLQLHDRIEMPEEADGKFQVDGLDPGPIRIELEGGTVHNHGWNIDLPDEGVWSLTDLVDAQVDWSPAVIGRAEAAAREARDHADRAEAGADRVGTAEQVGVWASEASSSASAATSARSGAVTARNAAQSARDAAAGHADRAATSESNAKTSETNAKQSETNAGDYAAVATTAATEAVDAMDSVSDIIGANYATHEYVESADEALGQRIDGIRSGSTPYLLGAGQYAGQFLKLNSNGQVAIEKGGITRATDATSKAYVDEGDSRLRSSTVPFSSSSAAVYASLDEVPLGVTPIWSGADNLGVPAGGSGIMTKISYGASIFYAWRYYTGTFDDPVVHEWHMWKRNGQGQWRKVAYDSDLVALDSKLDVALDALDGKLDVDVHAAPGLKTVPLAVTTGWNGPNADPQGTYRIPVQWGAPITRFRVHFSNEMPHTGNVSGDITISGANLASHAGDGAAGSTLATLERDPEYPQGGHEWVSKWVSGVDLTAQTLLEYSYAGEAVPLLATSGWKQVGDTWARQTGAPLWIWVEAETFFDTPVVALLGDSTGAGVGARSPVWESALALAGMKHGFLPQLYAHSGDSLGGNVSATDRNYTRWEDKGFARPDSVIIQLGSNDIHGGASLSTIKNRYKLVAENAAKISPVVIGATVKPRYPADPTYDPVRVEFNEWLRTLPHGIRDVVEFSDAIAPGGELPEEYDADGAHLTTLGHQQMATALDAVPVARPASVTIEAVKQASPIRVDTSVGTRVFTGDTMIHGDTGWRIIDNLLGDGWSGRVSIRRVGDQVWLRVNGAARDSDGATIQLVALPSGMNPEAGQLGIWRGELHELTTTPTPIHRVYFGSNDLRVGTGTESKTLYGELTWLTSEAWPATLPGTPA